MAFDPSNLSVIAYANGFTLWHYKSSDTIEAINSARYFNPAADTLRTGDVIFINGENNETLQTGISAVAKIIPDGVTISALISPD